MPGLLVATNERKGTAPPEFLNLTSRRGSLKAVTDPSLERRASSGLWTGSSEVESSLSRRGSSKRSSDLGWTKNPPSPSISRRPSLAASLLSRDHPSGTNIPHHRGRRPSSSSSAQSSSTIRAPGSGSPSSSGLLPFGHAFKSSASTRRSSHTPISQPSYPTTTPINAVASTSTATSPASSISPSLHHSPIEELNSYRFGSTSTNSSSNPPTPSAALNRRSSYDSNHRRHDFPEDEPNEEDEDLAREVFKASLLKAGLTSMSITMPPPSPTTFPSNPSTSYHSSSPSRTPDLITPTLHSSASDSYRFTFPTSTFTPSHRTRNYPSPRRRNESDQEDDNEEEEAPGPRTRRAVSRSNFLDARRMSLDHRKELNVDDEGSGIDDETESEEESDSRSLRPSTIGSPINGALLTFRNPFSGPTPPLDPAPSSNSPPTPLASFPPPSSSTFTPPATNSSDSSNFSTVGSSSLTVRPPPISSSPPALRRPSLNPWLADEDGMPAINMFTARVNTSPPRSLSDSAVPRRPSLAEEVGASIPEIGSGSASVSGHEEMEWDMDFVLGGGGQVNGVDFQTLSERAHPGSIQESFEYPSSVPMYASSSGTRSASARQAEEMGIDSFALFVQEKDPLFDKHRLAWTLNRTSSPSQPSTWTLPTTGGYTYIPSLSPNPSASNTTSGSFSNPSSASSSLSGPSSQPYPSTSLLPSRLPNAIIRGIRPPSPAWAIKPRGKGWGIIPLQGTRAEIKFGPKGKWRTKEPGSTGSGRGSGRAMQHQKNPSRDRRSMDSKGKSTSSSRKSVIVDHSVDSRIGASSEASKSKSSELGKVAWQDEYGSGGNGLGAASVADPFSRGRADPIPIVHPSPPPSPRGQSAALPAHTVSNPSSSGSSAPQRSSSRSGKKEGSKLKLKGGWLSSLKNASAVLTGKEPVSAAMSSRTSSMSGSGSGHEELRSASSLERHTYVPPWMSGHGKEKEKESSGFVSKIRFKRRSISDGVRRLSREKGSADEDAPFSFGSRQGGGGASSRGALSTDDETDDGEAREGKAWEDVPNEALAMVIPLSIPQSPASRRFLGSTSTTGTFPSLVNSDSPSSEYANFGAGWSPAGSPEIAVAGEVDPLASPPPQSSEILPPPPVEISLLVYFVPFGETPCLEPQSPTLMSTTPTGPGWLFNKKLKKTPSQLFKVGREGHSHGGSKSNSTTPTSPSFPHLPHHPTRPSLHPPSSFHSGSHSSNSATPTSLSSQTSSLGLHPSTFSSSSGGPPRPHFAPTLSSQQSQSPFSAFRIVARAVDPSDLTFLPSWPSWESQTSDAKHAAPDMKLSEPGTNPETKAKETKDGRTDPTVVGVCHGPDLGVEFVREGWERLGFVRPIGEGEGGGYHADQVGSGAFSSATGKGQESGEGGRTLEDVLGCLVAACVAIMGSNC